MNPIELLSPESQVRVVFAWAMEQHCKAETLELEVNRLKARLTASGVEKVRSKECQTLMSNRSG